MITRAIVDRGRREGDEHTPTPAITLAPHTIRHHHRSDMALFSFDLIRHKLTTWVKKKFQLLIIVYIVKYSNMC